MLDYVKFKKIRELFMQGEFEAAQRMLLALQARYIALHDEVSVLQKQVQELEDIIFLSQNLNTEGGQYWLRAGGVRHGPFCKSCYEYTGKLMRLEGHKSVWRCPYCGLLSSRAAESGTALAEHAPLPRQGKSLPFRLPRHYC